MTYRYSEFTNNIIWWTRKPLRLVCFILRQVDLGDDPCSTDQKLKILKEQDEALAAYMFLFAYKVSQCIGLIHNEHSVPLSTECWCFLCEFQLKYSGESVASSRSSTKLSSRRVLRHVGQVHESVTLKYLNKLAFFTVAERAQRTANRKNTCKLRKQLHQFDNTRAANAHNTTKQRNALQIKFFICLCCEHLQHLLSNWWMFSWFAGAFSICMCFLKLQRVELSQPP